MASQIVSPCPNGHNNTCIAICIAQPVVLTCLAGLVHNCVARIGVSCCYGNEFVLIHAQ